MSNFSNPGEVATYAERVARHVPGLRDLHRMVGLLLKDADVLRQAGFSGVELFYVAFTFKGWVPYR